MWTLLALICLSSVRLSIHQVLELLEDDVLLHGGQIDKKFVFNTLQGRDIVNALNAHVEMLKNE